MANEVSRNGSIPEEIVFLKRKDWIIKLCIEVSAEVVAEISLEENFLMGIGNSGKQKTFTLRPGLRLPHPLSFRDPCFMCVELSSSNMLCYGQVGYLLPFIGGSTKQ